MDVQSTFLTILKILKKVIKIETLNVDFPS